MNYKKGDNRSLSEGDMDLAAMNQVLPAGVTLTGDQNSWRRTGTIASMTVIANRLGIVPLSQKFSVTFINSQSGWKISQALVL
jgi:hypothetical protein